MTYVPERDKARERERMRLKRQDPEYRAKELEQQKTYKNTEHSRALRRERYENMPGPAYNKMLLRLRRSKALARMAKRHLPKEEGA